MNGTTTNDRTLRPYRIAVPDDAIADLHRRLDATRWPDALPGVGWDHGVDIDRLRTLTSSWRHDVDWRAAEARLNAFPQLTTSIDGANVHLLHVRSPEPDATPLLVTHGWPGSTAELVHVLGPLTDPVAHGGRADDAFHVVAPTIPGFTLSGPTTETGWGPNRIARAWLELMDRLGYDRFVAQGGDFGAVISPAVGRAAPDRVLGVHVNAASAGFMMGPDDAGALAELTEAERHRIESLQHHMAHRMGYSGIQSTRPQTLAYALTDSPVGQLAWNLEWFDDYGPGRPGRTPVPDEDILTNVSLYWFTGTAGSSARLYYESAQDGTWGPQPYSSVPTGVATFPGDSTVRRFAERSNRIVHFSTFERGGHFAALEAPDLLVDDIRSFVRTLRAAA